MAREFEERDHPPVLAIIGPLPWFAPTVLTNDAAVITELVRRSNRRIQTPRLIPRSNSSGNLQVRVRPVFVCFWSTCCMQCPPSPNRRLP